MAHGIQVYHSPTRPINQVQSQQKPQSAVCAIETTLTSPGEHGAKNGRGKLEHEQPTVPME